MKGFQDSPKQICIFPNRLHNCILLQNQPNQLGSSSWNLHIIYIGKTVRIRQYFHSSTFNGIWHSQLVCINTAFIAVKNSNDVNSFNQLEKKIIRTICIITRFFCQLICIYSWKSAANAELDFYLTFICIKVELEDRGRGGEELW